MRKVIKNVVKTVVAGFSTLLLAVLILPLAVSLLASLPAVQNAVVRRVTATLSQRLGTRVAIEHIDIKLINRVEVRGFYVEDFQGDTLLYVPALTAPVVELGLVGEPLTFGHVKLAGAEMWLRCDSLGTMNIRKVLAAVRGGRPPNPDSKFRMRIMGVEADSLTFGLLRGDRPPRAEGVDFSRFVIRNAKIGIDRFSIAGDSIRIGIRSLSFDERSGFHMDNLSVNDLVISSGTVALSDVGIRSGTADLDVPAIRLEGADRDWSDFRNFNDRVSLGVTMRSSRLSSDFLRFFVPDATTWGITFDNLSLHTEGALSALSGSIGRAARTLGTEFSLDFTSSGAPDLGNLWLDADVSSLSTSGGDMDRLMRNITGKGLPAGILAPLERMGALGFTGKFVGSVAAGFDAQGTLTSDAGQADVSGSFAGGVIDVHTSTSRFDLGRVLAVDELGAVSGELVARGVFGAKGQGRRIEGEADGRIAGLEFRDYTYTGITVGAEFNDGALAAKILARDPALDFDFSGTIDFPEGVFEAFSGELDLRKADLAATNLDRKNSVSTLSGRLAAQVKGVTPDDVAGTAELTGARYVSQYGSVDTPLATAQVSSDAAGKHIAFRSEFADADFRSRTPYRETFGYLAGFLRENIPLLRTGEREQPPSPLDGSDPAAAANYSNFELKIKNTERLLGVLSPGTGVAEGSEASLAFNPHTGDFSLSASSEYIESDGMLATNIKLDSGGVADSLVLHVASSDVYSGTMHIPGFELHGAVRGRETSISFDGETWLTATGTISHEAADTLHIRLDRFDLSTLGRLLGKRLDVGGRATGYIDIISTLRNPKMNAGIDLYSLSMDGMRAAPLRFTSFWDRSAERVRFQLLNRATDTGVLHGSLSPAGMEIDATAVVDSLDMALLDPLLGGVLENTQGKANIRLSLGGTLKNPRLDGSIGIPHIKTTVGYTKATYSLTDGELRIGNSVLTLPRTVVRDSFGGTADLSMKVDMTNISDVGVEIDAAPRGLLAFDTGADDSDTFYGRVFATGSMEIRAGRMGTRMDISVRTEPGSRVHLPLGASSNVSWSDFLVFVDPSRMLDTTNVLGRKKLAYERRLQGGSRAARRKPLDMNLTVNATRDAEMHILIDPNLGNGITATGEGVIGLEINPATNLFSMTGNYVISSGRFELSMMNVFHKEFTITPGSTLRWSGAPDDATLDVEAAYRVRTSLQPLLGEESGLAPERSSVPVDCILQMKERLSEPGITFDIALPSADHDTRLVAQNAMNTQELKSMQFLSLLTTGSFARNNSIAGQYANTGALASGAVGFDILTNTLGNFLSNDDYDIYFRYRPEDNFMTNQFDVGLSTGFVNDRLLLEIEGNYVDDRARTSVGTTSASNLAGDVSLTWVIDRTGNLRLKVFSQTIDRLNETQGLQESGLGVYWKKDFDRFGDIFVKKSSKFAPDSVSVKTTRRKEQLKTE